MRLTTAGVIVLDIVLFILCAAAMVIMILSGRPGTKSAIDATGGTDIPAVVALSLDAAAQPQNSSSPAAEPAQERQTAPQPIEVQPEEAPSVPGDFSAAFPAQDTGAGALLSYQSQRVRIAITQRKAYDSTYYIADVWVKDIEAFQTAFAMNAYGQGRHEMPLETANRAAAVFAVSGDYYGARSEGVVVRNGLLYRDVMSEDVCILNKDGTVEIFRRGTFSSIDTLDETVWQAWAFGPALVENGAVCDTSQSSIRVKNPRCAIGYYEPGHYCFIVVDGRQKGYSDGMSLDELAATFAALGCQTAYNLDGGATAMMVFQGELVNQPANGGRTSSDIICF
jgi:exopolysaccharide biosynthesis protein